VADRSNHNDCVIRPGSRHDIPALLELQKANLVAAGGTLSVQFSSEWIERSMAEMPIIVAERDGALVGYLMSSSRAATQHFALSEAKYHAYPAHPTPTIRGHCVSLPMNVAKASRGGYLRR
jgi:hypothetical protein